MLGLNNNKLLDFQQVSTPAGIGAQRLIPTTIAVSHDTTQHIIVAQFFLGEAVS